MSTARDEILRRIRAALTDVPAGESASEVVVARGYRRRGDSDPADVLELLAERLVDYHADVRRVPAAGVGAAVGEACRRLGLRRVVVPAALPAPWRPDGVELIEDHGLTARELDGLDGAITGCASAIAQTGTLVLDGEGTCGRRILTLVPDHHICVVRASQVVELVPEAIAALAPAVTERRAPVTLISGPSATSDIELSRVEGVHGPRHLLVLIVADPGGA
ncbi:MAG: LutC/YkgG family protein [Solirubrobacteraceae bacterium]